MDPLSGILSICWQANDAAFGGIYENYVDSLTYALRNLSFTFLYKVCNLMPPDGGIIRCKPKVIGEVIYNNIYLLL